ncbi:hypothetical protein [Helicobacter sp. L8]|uniref:hypothetical protein n=1 Tax=Helicobacter sp. L8 TaxID=2316078 RepID=UPI0013CDE1CF|nr:hypothetical protein [Helicobacter sp. L8]
MWWGQGWLNHAIFFWCCLSVVLLGGSFLPLVKIYQSSAPSRVWAWRCAISGVFNALAVAAWYALFI